MPPKEQGSCSSAFQFVGLDYMGPIYVKHESELMDLSIFLSYCKGHAFGMGVGPNSCTISLLF